MTGTRRRLEDISFRHVTEPLQAEIVLETLAKLFLETSSRIQPMIGIGNIGTGEMARVRAQAFLECQDVRIVAGWTRSEKVREAYRKLTGARGTSDAREVFNDPAIDVICIGTPTSTHADFAVTAVQAGKHVLVECPAAGDLKDLDRMVQAAEQAKRVIYIGSNYRFCPAAQAMAYAATHLGEIRLAQGDSSWSPYSAWFLDRALSGGLFTCVHLYPLALFHCLGRARWIEATMNAVSSYGVALVKYASGALGVATGGFQTHGINEFWVVGSEGLMRQEADGQFVLRRGQTSEPIPTRPVNATAEDNACFLRCVRGEEDWRLHWARERAILVVALAAQQSAESDRRVAINAPA